MTNTTLVGTIRQPEPRGMTLLQLVTLLDRETESPDETVESAFDLLESGQVFLTGNFRGCRLRRC